MIIKNQLTGMEKDFHNILMRRSSGVIKRVDIILILIGVLCKRWIEYLSSVIKNLHSNI